MKLIGIFIGVITVFCAGWFLRPALENNAEQVSGETDQGAKAPDGRSSAGTGSGESQATQLRRTKTVIVEQKGEEEELKNQIQAEQIEQYAKSVVGGFEKKLRFRLDQLLSKLDLDEAQLAQIEAFFQQEVSSYEEVSQKLFRGEVDDAQDLEALKNLSNLSGLSEAFEEILTPEQLEVYEVLEREEKQERVESSALRKLAGLQTGLDLTDEQKDAVYEVLYDEAEESVNYTSVTGEIMSGLGAQSILDSSGMGEFMSFSESPEARSGGGEGGDIYERFLESKTSRFTGIFTDEQQASYRERLEQQIAPIRAQAALLEQRAQKSE